MSERQRLYWVYADMKSRCCNPNHKAFKNYGGRGICVCDRWSSFEAFVTDMGERPVGGMLDRIDNDSDYDPGNCKWSTRTEQNSNRRLCIYVEHDGEKVTLKEACRRLGILKHYTAVTARIRNLGWPVGEALEKAFDYANDRRIKP